MLPAISIRLIKIPPPPSKIKNWGAKKKFRPPDKKLLAGTSIEVEAGASNVCKLSVRRAS